MGTRKKHVDYHNFSLIQVLPWSAYPASCASSSQAVLSRSVASAPGRLWVPAAVACPCLLHRYRLPQHCVFKRKFGYGIDRRASSLGTVGQPTSEYHIASFDSSRWLAPKIAVSCMLDPNASRGAFPATLPSTAAASRSHVGNLKGVWIRVCWVKFRLVIVPG